MNLSQFNEILLLVNTEEQAEKLLNKYLADFGFQFYAFTYYSGHIKTGRKLIYEFASEALRPWHLYYLEQSYADVDRTLEEINQNNLPFHWDVHEQLASAKNKREKRIRVESIEFGIDRGLSIQIHGPNSDFVNLTLHQTRGENCLKNFEQFQFEWWSATNIFYHHIKRLLNVNHTSKCVFKLTRREKQCLLLTAKSWRVEQIARELNISSRTVNFHLQNVIKKLGTKNKYQAVNKYFEFMDDD